MSDALPVLLGDIGGTNARFVLAAPEGAIGPLTIVKTESFASVDLAIQELLGPEPRPLAGAGFCVAGPVRDGKVKMTNCPWTITQRGLAAATGIAAPVLINDFAALAQGLPTLAPGDVRAIGPPSATGQWPVALIGPGTGLGVSGLLPGPKGSFVAISGEGGHINLAAGTPRELRVISRLMETHEHISAERILSGSGLEILYETLSGLEGKAERLTAPQIDAAALRGDNPIARETIAMFTGFLGAVAGDIALILGATGGVYLGGGILPRWGALFNDALFRERFEAKGRFQPYMTAIPTAIIAAPDIAMRGLRRLVLDAQADA